MFLGSGSKQKILKSPKVFINSIVSFPSAHPISKIVGFYLLIKL